MDESTYSIWRFFRDANVPKKLIDEGLTLEEAQDHCSSPHSESKSAGWFDGYEEE